jgi:general secretion pathway protein J
VGHTRGFTLLEMLLAMALTSVLAGSLYASMNTAFRGREAADRALGPAARVSATLAIIQDDLTAAVVPAGLLAGEFLGESSERDGGEAADVLYFHSRAADQSGLVPASPVVRVEYLVAEDEETGEAVLERRTTANLLAPEEPEATPVAICRGVQAFDVAYFSGTDWSDSWDSTTVGNALPLAVNVTVELEPSGAGEPPYAMSRTFALPCSVPGALVEAGSAPMTGSGR